MGKNTLSKTKVDTLTRSLDTPGLFTCNYEYKVQEAKGVLEYTGPKIPKDGWDEVLAFFRHVNDTTHSEAQVRMFFDPEDNKIFFHAFPQAKNTGMTARELDNEESKAQRANLPNAANLIVLGTVHSHCSAGAFQSGTDEQNEESQDGLHITVGHLHQDVLSIHARFYRKKDLFDPDLSAFWDIGDALSQIPDFAFGMLPDDAEDRIARAQMCKAPPKEQAFPELWKENVMEPPVITLPPPWVDGDQYWKDGEFRWNGVDRYQKQNGKWVFVPSGVNSTYEPSLPPSQDSQQKQKDSKESRRKKDGKDRGIVSERIQKAFDELSDAATIYQVPDDEFEEALEAAASDEIYKTIVQVCKDYEITPSDLLTKFKTEEWHRTQKALEEYQGGGYGAGWNGIEQ